MAELKVHSRDPEKGEVTGAVSSSPRLESITPISIAGTNQLAKENARTQNDSSKVGLPLGWIRQLLSLFGRLQSILASLSTQETFPRTTIVRALEQCPEGYPRLAAFIDSDENFMLYRRFGFLQARLLLHKQDELRELETDLDRMDKLDLQTDPSTLKSREKDDALSGRRKKLFSEIEERFKEYAQLLSAARELASLHRPSGRDYLSVKGYFDEEAPLCNMETYIYRKEDIITLKSGRENAWLDVFVERVLQKFSCRFIRYLFSSSDLRVKANPKTSGIILYNKSRIDFVVSLVITVMILTLLIVPVYILWSLTREIESTKTTAVIIAVLLVCTLVFSGVISLFTRARRHEVLASAAAYCAVLVVFIGNVGQISPNTHK